MESNSSTPAAASVAEPRPAAEPRKRAALGKGLESLLGPRPQPATVPAVAASAAAPEPTGTPIEIPVEQIDQNPHQTRTVFDEAKLEELARSIAASGVLQPVTVRELPGGRYQLIMGERRWRASKRAGRTTIPAFIRHVSDEQAMEMTIVENLQRADLNPMEQARAYERLSREFFMTQEQMSSRTGKDRASVANYLRLLRLPRDVQHLIESGELSYGHGRALLGLDSSEAILEAAAKIRTHAMSVRQAENYVQEVVNPEQARAKAEARKPAAPAQDPNVREAQETLQRRLGLRVKIEDRRGKGRVIIEYSGVDDFDAILEALGEPAR